MGNVLLFRFAPNTTNNRTDKVPRCWIARGDEFRTVSITVALNCSFLVILFSVFVNTMNDMDPSAPNRCIDIRHLNLPLAYDYFA